PAPDHLSVPDRAPIGNRAPEYGATCGFFPVDTATIDYLKTSGRKADRVALVSAYAKAQGLFRSAKSTDPKFTETLTLDLGAVVPSMAGPKRPEGRVALPVVAQGFGTAPIPSCTNPPNPSVLIGAGLLARNAAAKGLKAKPWVKTSLAPGSQV